MADIGFRGETLMRRLACAGLLAVYLACDQLPAEAQSGSEEPRGPAPPVSAPPEPELPVPLVAGSPAVPVAPEMITRDADGRATVRAVRVAQPLQIDGILNEAHYTAVGSLSDFIQVEPQHGAPATEKTEIWVSFDNTFLYISARMWDTELDRLVATEMRRDSNTMFQGNDVISFIFDTFYDHRNGVMFTVNPIGGRSDTQVTGERQFNQDWNPVWELKTGRFEQGWTAELAIPFKSLRYQPGSAQVWGFNAMRTKRSKNEMSLLTKVPLGRQQAAITQISYAAALVGIQAPRAGRNLDIKPYAISSVTTNRVSTPRLSNDPTGDVGVDVKYSVTQGLAADVTVNTDFAQVEADEQQINLTRYSLFFPEKREFFLENQGTFAFGGVQLATNFNTQNNTNATVAPILFYSRRIGLNQGRVVPLEVGGRLTGRAGRYSLGVLTTQTGAEDEHLPLAARSTSFSVVRVRRDVLRRSSVGLIATGRSVAQNGVGGNLAYGLDGTFAFFSNLNINTYWAKTDTTGLHGDDTSYRLHLDYNGDRYGVQLERLAVGDHFNPELGFIRRDDMRRNGAQLRFSPRPKRARVIRRFRYQVNFSSLENGAGIVESREREGEFAIEFQSGDQFQLGYSSQYELLLAPFPIAPTVSIATGAYDFQDGRVTMNFGRHRRVGGNVSLERGTFYSGHRTTFSASQTRVSVTNALSLEPTVSVNKVDLVEGAFNTRLAGSRVTYTLTPLMFVSALVQYNTATNSVSTNARMRWEYRPGSEFFVVYNDERNTLTRGFPSLATRSFVVKINRLFRY